MYLSLVLLTVESARVTRAKGDVLLPEVTPSGMIEFSAKQQDMPKRPLVLCDEAWKSDTFIEDAIKGGPGGEGGILAAYKETFGEEPAFLADYAKSCLEGYHPVPYHHRGHAVDVFHYFLNAFGTSEALPVEERKAIAVGLLCHDYGHAGLNNKYQVKFHFTEPAARASFVPEDADIKAAVESIDAKTTWDAEQGTGEVSAEEARAGGSFALFFDSSDPRGSCAKNADGEPVGPVCFPGCFPGCSSIDESYHALHAKEICERSEECKSHVNVGKMVKAIVATDMGNDAHDRLEVWKMAQALDSPKDPETLRSILIHLTDISGASSDENLCWSAGIHAEFKHQSHLLGGSPPNAKTLEDWRKMELGWANGVKAFLATAFKVAPDAKAQAFRDARLAAIDAHIAALTGCPSDGTKALKEVGAFTGEHRELQLQQSILEILKSWKQECGK